jgi:hypothetical protein
MHNKLHDSQRWEYPLERLKNRLPISASCYHPRIAAGPCEGDNVRDTNQRGETFAR